MTTAPITADTSCRPRLRGFVLAAVISGLMLTLFLEALDQTIVGAAMPQIIEELHGLDRYSWVVTGLYPRLDDGDSDRRQALRSVWPQMVPAAGHSAVSA